MSIKLFSTIYNCHYEKIGNEVKNIEDEIPFEIPNTWCWCKMSNISNIVVGATPSTANATYWSNGNIPWLPSGCCQDGEVVESYHAMKMISQKGYDSCSTTMMDPGTVLIALTGATAGKVGLLKFRACANQSVVGISTFLELEPKFVFYQLMGRRQEILSDCIGSAQPHISKEYITKMYFALPPYAEQKRIINEIEKIEPLITEYNKLEKQKTKLDSEIYGNLKKSILQYAIQGKLVPQDPNDEPASVLLEKIRAEKKAQLGKKYVESYIYKGDDNCYYEHINGKDTDITESIPFDLPNGWEWARLKNIIISLTDGTHSTPKYQTNGVPFISVKDISTGKLLFDNTKYISFEEHNELKKRCNPKRGDILLTKVGTTGIPVLIDTDIEFSLFVSVALIKFNKLNILPEYFIYLLKSPLVQDQATENTRGVGNKNWVLSDIEKTLLVLPPLPEQQRIVDKINEIFAKL